MGLDGAKRVRVELEMHTGQLRIDDRRGKLFEADLVYQSKQSKPNVDYKVSHGEGKLSIRQPFGEVEVKEDAWNEWEIGLSRQVPLDLKLDCGSGKRILELGEVDLAGVDVQIGSGETVMDFTSYRSHGFEARINHGTSSLLLRLPERAGVCVEVENTTGKVNYSGLRKEGNKYLNDSCEHTETALRFQIRSAGGELRLEVAKPPGYGELFEIGPPFQGGHPSADK